MMHSTMHCMRAARERVTVFMTVPRLRSFSCEASYSKVSRLRFHGIGTSGVPGPVRTRWVSYYPQY